MGTKHFSILRHYASLDSSSMRDGYREYGPLFLIVGNHLPMVSFLEKACFVPLLNFCVVLLLLLCYSASLLHSVRSFALLPCTATPMLRFCYVFLLCYSVSFSVSHLLLCTVNAPPMLLLSVVFCYHLPATSALLRRCSVPAPVSAPAPMITGDEMLLSTVDTCIYTIG